MSEEEVPPGDLPIELTSSTIKTSLVKQKEVLEREARKKEIISPSDLSDFEKEIQAKMIELFPSPDEVPEGINIFAPEGVGIRMASEDTGRSEDLWRMYAVEFNEEENDRGFLFILPREGECLSLGPYSEGERVVAADWSYVVEGGQREQLTFGYNMETGWMMLKINGEEEKDPEVIKSKFEAFKSRLLNYEPRPVSVKKRMKESFERIERMPPAHQKRIISKMLKKAFGEVKASTKVKAS